ncbi:hypothetical protein OG365_40390 (plasmid) [Streptomyces sp. NBC_00853]|uniref:hypothetical protein n=1 Tax=Streptomyces sp. NBC_00853 TaxID=2903681 RepID=UPI003872C414|nr:hypothetical protein OG365_40390 [Streptomyces sp. NBC_00853]
MSRLSVPARCVVHGEPCRSHLSTPDAVVIVVIAVLACGLCARGLDLSSVLAVLSGAGAVAVGTLMALRGGGWRLGHALVRVVHAVSAP